MTFFQRALINSVVVLFYFCYLHLHEVQAAGLLEPSKCTCSGLSCTCCNKMQIGPVDLQKNLCVQFTLKLLPVSVALVVKLDNVNVINVTIDPKKPPKYCLPMQIPNFDVCLQLHDVKLLDLSSIQICSTLMINPNSAAQHNRTMPCVRLSTKSGISLM